MKKLYVGILALCAVFSCAAQDLLLSGVWVYLEQYENWKQNAPEDIEAEPVRVDGVIYLCLPNPIIINRAKQRFSEQGGAWKILSIKKIGGKVYMDLQSYKDTSSKARLLVNFVDEKTIYFELESADGVIKNELGDVFGKDYCYRLCDTAK